MNLTEMILVEIEKTQAKLARFGLPTFCVPFTVTKMKNSKCIAFAKYSGELEFNEEYFAHPGDLPFAEIVAHEVAHLYQYKYFPNAKQGHGVEFRSLMRKLGFAGKAKVAVTGQAAMVSKVKAKTKTRHVYLTVNTKREILLTHQQHKSQQQYMATLGRGRFTSKGEQLVATNKVKKFK